MRGPRGVFTGERFPVAQISAVDHTGIEFDWPYGHPEVEYIGSRLTWTQIVDADPDDDPPRLVLERGRIAFISATDRDTLRDALVAQGIPRVQHRAWSLLLDYFLDTDYEILRERTECVLRDIGFDDAEFTAIRRRVAPIMDAFVYYTWEWLDLDHSDLVGARLLMPITPVRYKRFRQWTDRIAIRGRSDAPLIE